MQVKFTQDYQVKDAGTGRKANGLRYKKDETYDLSPESARHFIRKKVAEAVNEDEGAAVMALGPGGLAASLPPEQREPVFAKTVEETRRSREQGEDSGGAKSPTAGEAQEAPQSRKATMEAEGRAPKNPAKTPNIPGR